MVAGCGVDTEEWQRFEKHLRHFPHSPFVKMVLSPAERENYQNYPAELCLPISFCCKEAAFKALGSSWTNSPIQWQDIHLLFHAHPHKKDYSIKFSGHARHIYNALQAQNLQSDYHLAAHYITFEILLLHD